MGLKAGIIEIIENIDSDFANTCKKYVRLQIMSALRIVYNNFSDIAIDKWGLFMSTLFFITDASFVISDTQN